MATSEDGICMTGTAMSTSIPLLQGKDSVPDFRDCGLEWQDCRLPAEPQ